MSPQSQIDQIAQRVALLPESQQFVLELGIAKLQLGVAQQQALDAIRDLVNLGLGRHLRIVNPTRADKRLE